MEPDNIMQFVADAKKCYDENREEYERKYKQYLEDYEMLGRFYYFCAKQDIFGRYLLNRILNQGYNNLKFYRRSSFTKNIIDTLRSQKFLAVHEWLDKKAPYFYFGLPLNENKTNRIKYFFPDEKQNDIMINIIANYSGYKLFFVKRKLYQYKRVESILRKKGDTDFINNFELKYKESNPQINKRYIKEREYESNLIDFQFAEDIFIISKEGIDVLNKTYGLQLDNNKVYRFDKFFEQKIYIDELGYINYTDIVIKFTNPVNRRENEPCPFIKIKEEKYYGKYEGSPLVVDFTDPKFNFELYYNIKRYYNPANLTFEKIIKTDLNLITLY